MFLGKIIGLLKFMFDFVFYFSYFMLNYYFFGINEAVAYDMVI